MTTLVASIASAAEIKKTNEYPAGLTLAQTEAQVEAGCPGYSGCGYHNHCGGCCHNHCGNCCHNHCGCDCDSDDPTDEECDLSTRNCDTPSLCYNTLGWTVEDVFVKHDLDGSRCLDFCEWRWFYNCANVLHGWPSPSTDPNIIEDTFLKGD